MQRVLFLILSKLVTLLEVFFSSFSRAGQTNNAEGFFFLTFRSNREIFFCSFFRLSGWWGNERNYFCFFERKTPSLFKLFFKLYNLMFGVIFRIGLAFRKAFFSLDLDFFSFVDDFFFRSRIFFCLRFFVFFICFVFVFREQEMMMRWRI